MAEEIKRQAEEAAEASMEAESEAGAVSEEEIAQDTQTEIRGLRRTGNRGSGQ